MRQQDYGIHCQMRSEIFLYLTRLKIILLIDAVGKMFIAVPVNIKPCCFMHE
jgi:hypothetical protein